MALKKPEGILATITSKLLFFTYKLNNKTNLLRGCVKFVDALLSKHVEFVDSTKKQVAYFEKIVVLLVFILPLLLFFCFIYPNEYLPFF